MQTLRIDSYGRSYQYNNGGNKVNVREKRIRSLSQQIRISNSTVRKICRDDLSLFPYSSLLSQSSVDRRDAFATFNEATECLALLLRIRETSGSNLGSETEYPAWGFLQFSSLYPGECMVSTFTTASFHILYNSSFINHPVVRRYIVWATASVVK
jgi:hypothetical protein